MRDQFAPDMIAPMSDTTLVSISNQLADAVAAIAPSVVQVQGRRRPASGVVYATDVVLTTVRALGREDKLRVRTHDARELDAELAGWDPASGLAVLRAAGLKIGLVSNSARDVRAFAAHHALDIDAGISSFHHGKTKPHASIFRAVLELLEVAPEDAAMVGDTVEDDINGALALGMRAILVDRHGFGARHEPCIDDLNALPAALGLPRPGTQSPG